MLVLFDNNNHAAGFNIQKQNRNRNRNRNEQENTTSLDPRRFEPFEIKYKFPLFQTHTLDTLFQDTEGGKEKQGEKEGNVCVWCLLIYFRVGGMT